MLKKASSLQRCLLRVRETYAASPETLLTDYSQQDVIVLNIIQACEQAIDIAATVLSVRQSRGRSVVASKFSVLAELKIIPNDLAKDLDRMIGFRNIAVHQYQEIDFEIVRGIINEKLDQLTALADLAMDHLVELEDG